MSIENTCEWLTYISRPEDAASFLILISYAYFLSNRIVRKDVITEMATRTVQVRVCSVTAERKGGLFGSSLFGLFENNSFLIRNTLKAVKELRKSRGTHDITYR